MSAIALADPPIRPADIVWPAPTVHNVKGALDALGCFTERLDALFTSNTDDMQQCLLENEALPECLQSRAYSIWMIYVLAGEKLAEIQNLVGAATTAVYAEPATSIGRHVDLQRRRAWSQALAAYRAVEHNVAPDNADDETFNRIVSPICDTLSDLIGTRAPDLRALHEKLTIIQQQDAFHSDAYGSHGAVMSDVEYLARRYETDGPDAAQAGEAA